MFRRGQVCQLFNVLPLKYPYVIIVVFFFPYCYLIKIGNGKGLLNTCQVLFSLRHNVSRSTWNLDAASTPKCMAE